jgi:hypothetical protein
MARTLGFCWQGGFAGTGGAVPNASKQSAFHGVQVSIHSERAATNTVTLPSNIMSSLLRTFSEPCSDQWRLELLGILCQVACMRCVDAAAILDTFVSHNTAPGLQMLMLAVHDVLHIAKLESAVELATLKAAYSQLDFASLLIDHNPCGHYSLDMTNQVLARYVCMCSMHM